jgi:RNA polymerase primary sigma factor
MSAQKLLLEPRKLSIMRPARGVERSAQIEESPEGRVDFLTPIGLFLEPTEPCGRSRPGLGRANIEDHARRLLEQKLKYVYDRGFDEPDAEATILAPPPTRADRAPARVKPPTGLPPYLACLYNDATPLRPDQEAPLFLRMNYLKYRASKLRESLDPQSAMASDLDEIERLHVEARAVKDQIIRANLRLVVSIAKRRAGPDRTLFELVSEGNLSLLIAVEKFDVSRGFKFSTYASCVIMKNLARIALRENGRRHRFVTGSQELVGAAADHRTVESERESECDRDRYQEAVQGMLGRLGNRERAVIVSRFGLEGAREKTLHQLGLELGITRERVRQIESQAREKLRNYAIEQGLELAATRRTDGGTSP